MGYLDKSTITVDAILTNRGRELLAQGGIGNNTSFKITKFAVADDEVDYALYNTNQPDSGTLFGSIIENMPVLEATPDEQQIMRYKLVSLKEVNSQILIPFIAGVFTPVNITVSTSTPSPTPPSETFVLETRNIGSVLTSTPTQELTSEEYVLTISDGRLVDIFINEGTNSVNDKSLINANGSFTVTIPTRQTQKQIVRFQSRTGTEGKTATGTIFGKESGATATFEVVIS